MITNIFGRFLTLLILTLFPSLTGCYREPDRDPRCDQTCSLAKTLQSLSILQPFAQHCLLPHTHKATQRLFSALGPCVYCLLSALSLLFGTRRGSWRHSCQYSAEIRNLLVKLDDSNGRASKSISPQVRADPLGPTQRKHKAYDAHLHPLGDCVKDHCTAQDLSTRTSGSPWVDFNSLMEGHTLHLPLDAGRLGQCSTYSEMIVLAKCPADTNNALAASTCTQTAH